jgi:hypothetical protein
VGGEGTMMENLKSKIQNPNKNRIPKTEDRKGLLSGFEIPGSDFVWVLGFGFWISSGFWFSIERPALA